ncbi:MAG: hypothetical protein ACFBSG_12915 [Leptolyngbyaceae cyanobacterium]
MIRFSLRHSQQKAIFAFSVTLTYLLVIFYLNFLQGPSWRDEAEFWSSSLVFSNQLIPSLTDLKTYGSLNTPLPFIIFGFLEYLFGGDIVVGRLLNLLLSLGIIAAIGWPSSQKRGRALLCMFGLFCCPYYLWLSGRLYTEMIACVWVVIGLATYLRNRHLLASAAFVLAIASRQFMVIFPAAIATYEFLSVSQAYWQTRRTNWQIQVRWLLPLAASLSLLAWFTLFQGMAPASATVEKAPEVQKSLEASHLGIAVNHLFFVGSYIVVPELILFPSQAPLKALKENWQKWLIIAVALLIFCLLFPPPTKGQGIVNDFRRLLPNDALQLGLIYLMALFACIRFTKPDLMFWIVAFHVIVMTKSLPWERYILPLAVAFWYLKSVFPNLVRPSLLSQAHKAKFAQHPMKIN